MDDFEAVKQARAILRGINHSIELVEISSGLAKQVYSMLDRSRIDDFHALMARMDEPEIAEKVYGIFSADPDVTERYMALINLHDRKTILANLESKEGSLNRSILEADDDFRQFRDNFAPRLLRQTAFIPLRILDKPLPRWIDARLLIPGVSAAVAAMKTSDAGRCIGRNPVSILSAMAVRNETHSLLAETIAAIPEAAEDVEKAHEVVARFPPASADKALKARLIGAMDGGLGIEHFGLVGSKFKQSRDALQRVETMLGKVSTALLDVRDFLVEGLSRRTTTQKFRKAMSSMPDTSALEKNEPLGADEMRRDCALSLSIVMHKIVDLNVLRLVCTVAESHKEPQYSASPAQDAQVLNTHVNGRRKKTNNARHPRETPSFPRF